MACRLQGLIGGIDESGRGPLAGPVVSSCVIWKNLPDTKRGVNDSKLLSEKDRLAIFPWIQEQAYRIGVGIVTHEDIDKLNIHQASLLSMERALEDAGIRPDELLIDGRFGIRSFPRSRPIIKGDRKCFFIAAASIVAKVVRDSIMNTYHNLYPLYHFDRNKGYPTKEHKAAIGQFGVLPIHRKTFKGVREYLA